MTTGCFRPFTKKDNNGVNQQVPCGKCPKCRKRRVSGWSFRLMQQARIADSAYFITLTYNDNHLRSTDRGYYTISKSDLQLFFKRLRKAHRSETSTPIRYYAVGEYGGRSFRPHYHILLFNCQLELIQGAWSENGKHIGMVHYGDQRGVTGASVGYCLKYMEKPTKIGKYRGDDRQKEFALMSKGLGKNYLSTEMINWHMADIDNRMYINVGDGKKAAMPRYYKEKLYSEIQRKQIAQIQIDQMIKNTLKEFMKLSAKDLARERWNKQQSMEGAYRRMYSNSSKDTL